MPRFAPAQLHAVTREECHPSELSPGDGSANSWCSFSVFKMRERRDSEGNLHTAQKDGNIDIVTPVLSAGCSQNGRLLRGT